MYKMLLLVFINVLYFTVKNVYNMFLLLIFVYNNSFQQSTYVYSNSFQQLRNKLLDQEINLAKYIVLHYLNVVYMHHLSVKVSNTKYGKHKCYEASNTPNINNKSNKI